MAGNARDPLEIFPAEIWEFILKDLKNQGSSRDVLNCSKVCTEFERILEPTKQEWLFESICPFILPYLKGGELLACRRVCKNWRRGVDNFLEDSETWQPFNEETSNTSRSSKYDLLKQKKIKWTTKIRGNRELVNFLSAMKKQEMKTPFVGRSLTLEYRNSEPDYGMAGKGFFLEVLRLYGDHIRHLLVIPEDSDVTELCQFYQILNQMLGCTPKLKCLTVVADQKVYKPGPLDDYQLPKTISLETLEIFTYGNSRLIILEKLIPRINLGNLKCLKLHNLKSRKVKPVKTYAMVEPLQHLTELHVTNIRLWDDLKQIFANMISPTAPLAKLCLSFAVDKEIDFDGLCNLISRWNSTLRMLVIKGNMNSTSRKPGISLTKLDAPYLKSLELEGILYGTIFLPAGLNASLEYLHIRYTRCPGIFDPGMEFYFCVFGAEQLHNSAIWGVMKKLKMIRVERPFSRFQPKKVACTREMHERAREN